MTHWKDPHVEKDGRQEQKEMTEGVKFGWHHQLDGHEFEKNPGDGEGQESLARYSPWGCKETDITEQPNNDNKSSEKQFN